jgi:hypothetical protein
MISPARVDDKLYGNDIQTLWLGFVKTNLQHGSYTSTHGGENPYGDT